jgi:ATP-dependent protease ClpP protease subunit
VIPNRKMFALFSNWAKDGSRPECRATIDNNELSIFGPIVSAEDSAWLGDMFGPVIDDASVKAELGKLKAGSPLKVLINSPGGDVWTGMSIRSLLRAHSGQVDIYVTGIAASIASIIAMGGDSVTMTPGSTMMIHSAWTVAAGNARELRAIAENLDVANENIIGIYAARAKVSREELSAMLDKDSYMTAEKATELGFSDRVAELPKAAANGATSRAAAQIQPTAMSRLFLNTGRTLIDAGQAMSDRRKRQ